jgi:alpha-L-fucosidase
MKLGVYISPQDRRHGQAWAATKDPSRQADYEKLFRTQLTEVLANYGDMMEVWSDGSLVFDVGDIVSKHGPYAAVFQGPQASIRWVGNEIGIAPYPAWNAVKLARGRGATRRRRRPRRRSLAPQRVRRPHTRHLVLEPRNEASLKSVKDLVRMHDQSVGRARRLLLNLSPDTTGAIRRPTPRVRRSSARPSRPSGASPSAKPRGRGRRVRHSALRAASDQSRHHPGTHRGR